MRVNFFNETAAPIAGDKNTADPGSKHQEGVEPFEDTAAGAGVLCQ